MGSHSTALAQSGRVRGVVLDPEDRGIPGVTVTVTGVTGAKPRSRMTAALSFWTSQRACGL